jgi:hypothetical protein
MKVDDLEWEYQPLENPDWDYARNTFTVLKRPQATWSQSVFSARYENLMAPNRDYRFQGLCAFSNNEYWKFLDAIFFAIKGVRLEPRRVVASPWRHTYKYSGDGTEVDASYFLSRDIKEGISAKVVFDVKTSFLRELIVKPLVDIRNAFCESSPEQTATKVSNECLVASSGKNKISFSMKDSSILSRKEVIEWRYKLGSGFRESTEQGIKFVPEYSRPVFPGEIHKALKGSGRVSLLINCNRSNSDFDENEEKSYASHIAKRFDCKKEVMARILSLNSFGVLQNGISVPEAGDFWFRQVWSRDLLEAMINNFHTVSKIDGKKVAEIIQWLLKQQDAGTGMFPNFKGNYNSVDASLLFFILAEKYLEQSKDKALEKRIQESFRLLLKRLLESKEGPVVRDSMLYCFPWQSWTDSMVGFSGRKVPERIPLEWGDVDGQLALLPEINAMFIKFLKIGESLGIDTGEMYKKAVDGFGIFKNRDFLYSAIIGDKKDPTESSMALVSAVLLHNHAFSRGDLEKMWPSVEKLLVKREGKLFGMLCRNTKDRTYLNDYQYHGSVVWPRDTPYLIRYLQIIGKGELVKELLESNMEHQMREGAIFYSGELFSLPEGRNPSPNGRQDSPVPVKNPIQLWSNFCDAYIM